jgi:hypothetical protein
MSLDFSLVKTMPTVVFDANITHNLTQMASEAGIYDCLWRPDEHNMQKAHQIIAPLSDGLARMLANPDKYRQLNPPNGWGNYEGLVEYAKKVLCACIENPDADVEVSR